MIKILKILKILSVLFFVLFFNGTAAVSLEKIFIVYKINNQIITNVDLKNELKYLLALNPQLENVPKKKLEEITKKSIIKDTIKKSEVLKYYLLDQTDPLLLKILNNFYTKLGIKSKDEFEIYLTNFNLTIIDVLKRIEIETVWNQMIYEKYKDQIQINQQELRDIINLKNNSQKEKLLSLVEIVFEKEKGKETKEKINRIQSSIKDIGFENTANIYSISESSKLGGKIGWINQQSLSEKFIKELDGLKIGEHTRPISIGNSYIMLKIQNVKEQIIEFNKDIVLKQMITLEENKQLESFSKIYYNKVKINSQINEL
ncbi:peptidylprolyl isomerase [Candidatus Pelagibacter sp.]|nr:peptidylprolyl isomerase [Candidatus Pelagibacter sp.]